MFVCISPNPAIDKRLQLSKLALGKVNRAAEATVAPGGKAAHVAMVLKALGADPLWLGFAGGANGDALCHGLDDLGIRATSISIEQSTRNNLEIIDADGTVTEILEPGPNLSLAEVDEFQNQCEQLFANNAGRVIAVLSGSLPRGLPQDYYACLIRQAHYHGCKTFLDSSGEPLRLALQEGPDFVKPNREEAEWLLGIDIPDFSAAADAVRSLLAKGARSAAISLGAQGLVWCPGHGEAVYSAQPPVMKGRSAVGSGDAVVAGFAYAMSLGLQPEESIRTVAACGAANCLAELPGQLNAQHVRRLKEEVRVCTISEA